MTFSLVVRDAQTGAFGSLISSSSPAVAARCVHLRDGVGAVHSQNVTDPRLGPRLLDLLAAGAGAADALSELVAGEPTADWRQLLLVDAAGRTAVHSGAHALGTVGEHAVEGAAAAGNLLATPRVPQRLVEAYLQATGSLERRLLAAYEAAMAEGGEAGPVHSAGLSVVTGAGWRVTDLRVDWSETPLQDLTDLLQVWEPQREDYIVRALRPEDAPGYGVPGDQR
ncbi:DUF1028 domain-containing protein [Kineococcus vitellinus]|uniref:DUF1028 domain-containing protein n=1 Tax=Kineococcus vitellinus TaxID=2696565 RepID=UPI0030B86056